MITTQINIIDEVSPDIAKKISQLENTAPLMRAVGEAMRRAMREHYAGLPPNQSGLPSLGFWNKYGRDKVAIASFDNAHVRVVVDSKEMGHKLFGGTVTGKGKKLSIPVSAEAKKTGSATLWSGPKLTLIPRPGKPPLLVDATNDLAWKIHYVLKASVTHKPDDRAFPPREMVHQAVIQTITEKLNLIMRVS
ncbi:MAG TPA: hypothetical protein PJ991_13090 [Kiritimatiellia bacterium]|nr:hypothetical protein [Kiritimatiellia bacterium]